MKATATIVIASILLAAVYGVVFSSIYPSVEITGNILALCALLGIGTSLIVAGLWRAAFQRKARRG
jgi:hypothetical protein